MSETAPSLVALTAELVAAYLRNNQIPPAQVPEVIQAVHASLNALGAPVAEPEPELKPAVPIKKSITPDYLISLESGRKMKTLKRYLMTSYGMLPDDYRKKWGLPSDYPMVAPNYSAARSSMARDLGLGRKAAPAPEPVPEPAPKRRGRKKATAE